MMDLTELSLLLALIGGMFVIINRLGPKRGQRRSRRTRYIPSWSGRPDDRQ